MKKILILFLSFFLMLSLTSCDAVFDILDDILSSLEEPKEPNMPETPEVPETPETPDEPEHPISLMTYQEFMAAEAGAEVAIEGFIAAKQSWWDNKVTMYLTTENSGEGYFIYEFSCSEEENNSIYKIGEYIHIEGTKTIYAGEHEIMGENITAASVVDKGTKQMPEAIDLTGKLGELELYQNSFFRADLEVVEFVSTSQDVTVSTSKGFGYKGDTIGNDLYFTLSDGTNVLNCCVEYYLTNEDTDVYTQTQNLKIGDSVTVYGYLYWWNGPNPHITSLKIEVVETPEVPETPETPEVPETPETPEVPETPETPEVPETPEIPETPETPETPEVPETPETPETPEVTVVGELQIHFLELGNSYSGDCTYIKAGDIDILIDAGSRKTSSTTIINYVDQYCTDKILEYVIVTHAHQDHIAAFVDTSTSTGIFSYYEVKTIIDFSLKNTTSQISKDYISARDKEVALGANHYTANDCINGTNGGKRVFQLTENISFEILEQKYYYTESSNENNYSVCTLFTHGEEHFLFTGDLELEGEESLVQLNNLPKVKLFKGGHHGSKTSSNECLLSVIQPEIVCICTCAGSDEYTRVTDNMFVTQEAIDRIAKYTDKIYVTSLAIYEVAVATSNSKGVSKGEQYLKTTGFTSMNGNIVVTSNNNGVTVNCSNNNTILKDTEWFNTEITLNGVTRKMRVWPSEKE